MLDLSGQTVTQAIASFRAALASYQEDELIVRTDNDVVKLNLYSHLHKVGLKCKLDRQGPYHLIKVHVGKGGSSAAKPSRAENPTGFTPASSDDGGVAAEPMETTSFPVAHLSSRDPEPEPIPEPKAADSHPRGQRKRRRPPSERFKREQLYEPQAQSEPSQPVQSAPPPLAQPESPAEPHQPQATQPAQASQPTPPQAAPVHPPQTMPPMETSPPRPPSLTYGRPTARATPIESPGPAVEPSIPQQPQQPVEEQPVVGPRPFTADLSPEEASGFWAVISNDQIGQKDIALGQDLLGDMLENISGYAGVFLIHRGVRLLDPMNAQGRFLRILLGKRMRIIACHKSLAHYGLLNKVSDPVESAPAQVILLMTRPDRLLWL